METEKVLCSLGIDALNAELNPICHLLALLGAHHILHVGRMRVKLVVSDDAEVKHCVTDLFLLGVLVKFPDLTIGFVLSTCQSVCPHGTTRLPLDRFSSNFYI